MQSTDHLGAMALQSKVNNKREIERLIAQSKYKSESTKFQIAESEKSDKSSQEMQPPKTKHNN